MLAGSSVYGLQRRPKQQLRFFVARRPAAFAIHALPGDLELFVDQHYSLGTAAAGTTYAVFVEHVLSGKSSLHEELVGSYNPIR